jgi:hypothetical protein
MSQLAASSAPARSSDLSAAPDTRLRGRWLMIARAIWVVLATFALGFFIVNLPSYFQSLQTVCLRAACADKQLTPASAQALQRVGISLEAYAAFALALTLFSFVVWLAVGGVLAWRKSDDWMALLVSLTLVLQGTANLI